MLNIEMLKNNQDINDYSIIYYFEEGGSELFENKYISLPRYKSKYDLGIRKLGAIDQGSLKITYTVYLNICI